MQARKSRHAYIPTQFWFDFASHRAVETRFKKPRFFRFFKKT